MQLVDWFAASKIFTYMLGVDYKLGEEYETEYEKFQARSSIARAVQGNAGKSVAPGSIEEKVLSAPLLGTVIKWLQEDRKRGQQGQPRQLTQLDALMAKVGMALVGCSEAPGVLAEAAGQALAEVRELLHRMMATSIG